jgi:uncharacterized membrane protein YvlD (DUF360 family)
MFNVFSKIEKVEVCNNKGLTPHLLSKCDSVSRQIYKEKYKKIKKAGAFALLGSVGLVSGLKLAKDIATSKLKAFAYKEVYIIAAGPFLQLFSLPLYTFSYGMKFRSFAIAIMEIGAKISKGEMEAASWSWILIDFILFGEYISAMEDTSLMLIRNETESKISNIIDSLGAGSD